MLTVTIDSDERVHPGKILFWHGCWPWTRRDTGAHQPPWLSKQQQLLLPVRNLDVGGTRIDGTIEYTFRDPREELPW
jgi:hypothetical protein